MFPAFAEEAAGTPVAARPEPDAGAADAAVSWYFRSIDNYCERLDASFWSEPLNAVTNLAFIAAAVGLVQLYRHSGETGWRRIWTAILLVLITLIGIGSFLFHTVATGWALLADIIPITGFIFVFYCLTLRRVLQFSVPMTGLGVSAFIAFRWVVSQLFDLLQAAAAGTAMASVIRGFGGYAGALFALLLIGGYLVWRHGWADRPARWILTAGGLFFVSLSFRAVDGVLCPVWPHGTHFLWHILNAAVLYSCVRAVVPPPQRPLA